MASYWDYGQRFVYDGFGNLTDKQITRGWAPTLSVTIDKSKNRIASSPYVYDANSSVTQQPGYGGCGTATLAWDTFNRMTSITAGGCGSEYYKYGPDGLRVWKKTVSGTTVERYFFYGPDGNLLGEYEPAGSGSGLTLKKKYVYFGGKLIRMHDGSWKSAIMDRTGNVVGLGTQELRYFPYGEELLGPAPENEQRYGTYYRDDLTSLDYARQRYYDPARGRFTSPDPYRASGGPADPSSWNRYAYVQGDPVNFWDPSGLCAALAGTSACFDTTVTAVASQAISGFRGPGGGDFPQHLSGEPDMGGGLLTRALNTYPLYPSATWEGALNRLNEARDFVALFLTNPAPPCDDTLSSIGITPTALIQAANSATFHDALESTVPYADLWQYTPAAAAARAEFGSTTIASHFAVNPAVHAAAELKGNNIYFRPSGVDRYLPSHNFGLLLHELLHNVTGQSDSQLKSALGISPSAPSAAISRRLRQDCFRNQ